MFIQTMRATSNIINHHNLMTNSNSTPLSFERPTPKSLKIVEHKTCFEILDEYSNYRCTLGRSKMKNILQDHQIIKVLLHFIGFLELNELDRSGAEHIANVYRYRPKNPKKYLDLKGLQGYDLIAKNESLPHPREYISLSTVKGHLEKMSTFMAWAKYHGYISDNVFYKLPTKKISKAKTVFSFNNQQLSAIFSMPDYIKHQYRHSYYYWVPLLLRYTGARLNEICQLTKYDIVIADDIYCLLIREAFDDQSVKTGKSRLIPLHDEILNKGFIDFVNSKSDIRLFPELPFCNGYYSHNASKWFARRRKMIGIDSQSGVNAHSFRRNFINELKQKLVSKPFVESIVGHEHAEKLIKLPNEIVNSIIGLEHNSESFDTYGEQYSPKILQPIINCIDVSHTAHIRPYFSI
ncbi:tyrosine-type recombinase/integrase [Photobacterium carnosum]|uniref:site-specific integrase n=1 Tax=Photobacterium carnosum TaxID=2023717 RepID=UPI001F2FA40E|nr:site-specific integrase [Photobacterium carnosum]MCF2153444.1 tyrosine-type recombinase/integrase [Photobacterium carnosum]MCF2215333.1 tyrosine-type recombinase/integrase [Photobacterium carnosum]